MQGNWWQFHTQNRHILNEQGICPGLIELPDEFLGIGQLRVFEYGVYGHIDPGSVEMGKTGQLCYILHAVAGSLTCAEPSGTYVHGIGAMLYGLNAALQILGRSKQFYGPSLFHLPNAYPVLGCNIHRILFRYTKSLIPLINMGQCAVYTQTAQ